MTGANPTRMTVRRPGGATRAAQGISSAPFWVEMLLEGAEAENTAMRATLDSGTITHWHTHPRGQWLYALSGMGLAQRDGGPVEVIRAGDSVWFAAGERHWHGAAADSPFSYISVQSMQDGRVIEWMEPVEAGR